ncbi:mitosis inhibitor protein kinase swe1 [Friedmanniomyces endolithicus]|uniref:Mitosis inhibitor protein kinase swe1 n=1 Tax=Friedmanniomyces endolithicus TaxID=329885 RepID=A0AAN6H9N3_9PEZI|nr:mitosis inhibitor protein kinase swe1 [Friedmanniomyces endolithicus]KAK0961036.1 mitosis inhibitor protein kinase swe1 [Friedmanniomyces endolithicus]KAK0971167.1 mitosis inhibitor protein kinase swe1 [Friedmanniomyces endolithicus]
MEFSPGSAPHLLSPTHAHRSPLDTFENFSAIRQLRRSLSRSPSKPQRFSLSARKTSDTSSPAPASPSNLSRAFSADTADELCSKSRYSGKRAVGLRAGSRRTSPNSPLRRALSDNANQAHPTPRLIRTTSAEEAAEDQENIAEGAPTNQDVRFTGAGRVNFLKPDKLLKPVMLEHVSPMKSSPLKRSDGVMDLEAAGFGSPRAKRRSLHGAGAFGDFNVFDQGLDGTHGDSTDSSASRSSDEKERESVTGLSSTWPAPTPNSPHRRPLSLRKSTLHQRVGPGRSRLFQEPTRDTGMNPALTRARSRISLDSALPLRTIDFESPFRRNAMSDAPSLGPPAMQKPFQSAPKPHPLSHALTPSSSNSSMADEPAQQIQQRPGLALLKRDSMKPPSAFSHSLPIGAMRPASSSKNGMSQESFATPEAFKMAKPLPQAFHSTGLISKRNRKMDMPPTDFASSHMPDTPSKKAAHIHVISSPAPASVLGKVVQPLHEFGSPTTPFNGRPAKVSPQSFGKGVNIFGSRVGIPQLTRRGSFLSIDGDENSISPTHRLESKASIEELPPTPTKSTATVTVRPQSKGKSNSLRSSLFGRRTSLGPDTFASPASEDLVPADDDCTLTDFAIEEPTERHSPHTPHESFTPPDPSSLSISADQRPSTAFGRSVNSFPPATPTGPRDHNSSTSFFAGNDSSSYFANDVDISLTSRFAMIHPAGNGEFSQVYKVEKPLAGTLQGSQAQCSPSAKAWAVKKSRKPYTGQKDRQRKMREIQVLKGLRGSENIVEFVDFWEAKNHLYIQTEYCENGNLKDFLLRTGYKGRLDDFRVWKILLEVSQGIKSVHDANFMHLDLKPANVLLDWEGVLKIADFGLASAWPAPPNLDGEGDREYIGPEVLAGRFDKPADIFALGMVMLEIAGNIVLPDNGTSWQRLRAGDLSDLPSLTWTSDSSLVRDESGDPVEMAGILSNDSLAFSSHDEDELGFLRPAITGHRRKSSRDLVSPPAFMVDQTHPDALEQVVQWMIRPDPHARPTVDQLLQAGGVQWVEQRRRAGATVYEGSWGPADSVVSHGQDVEMMEF